MYSKKKKTLIEFVIHCCSRICLDLDNKIKANPNKREAF